MTKVVVTTTTRLTSIGKAGAGLVVAAPFLGFCGYQIIQNGDPAGAARAILFIATLALALGVVMLAMGRSHNHVVTTSPD